VMATEIGAAYKNGDINQASRYIAHAALGAGMDLATGGGGVSGAVGAVVGEATAELYLSQYVEEKLRPDRLKGMTREQFAAEAHHLKELGVNLSALSAGIAAAVIGKDVDAAAMTGKNAARNNEMVVLIIAIALVALEVADKAMIAVDAWELAQAVAENDQEKVEAKALEIGVGLATDAVPGNVVTIKIGKLLHGFGVATVGAKVVAKAGGKVDEAVEVVERIVTFSDKQLQQKFKHAVDFGIDGNLNPQKMLEYKDVIARHINDPNVLRIQGSYRGDSVVHYFNKKTGVNVMTKSSGEFISGWKLNEKQIENIISRGSL